jgi:hypothetical protein
MYRDRQPRRRTPGDIISSALAPVLLPLWPARIPPVRISRLRSRLLRNSGSLPRHLPKPPSLLLPLPPLSNRQHSRQINAPSLHLQPLDNLLLCPARPSHLRPRLPAHNLHQFLASMLELSIQHSRLLLPLLLAQHRPSLLFLPRLILPESLMRSNPLPRDTFASHPTWT